MSIDAMPDYLKYLVETMVKMDKAAVKKFTLSTVSECKRALSVNIEHQEKAVSECHLCGAAVAFFGNNTHLNVG